MQAPSTGRATPVMKRASSLHRERAAAGISATVGIPGMGLTLFIAARTAAWSGLEVM